jgi:hypothetical protein
MGATAHRSCVAGSPPGNVEVMDTFRLSSDAVRREMPASRTEDLESDDPDRLADRVREFDPQADAGETQREDEDRD